ncbi:PDR/VanB family oxidoreductase [Nocardia jiangxiensis]|uniref:PDR/VanB family oxidoreductase n=1 Tax=Nocardia jiangxiensis TaxID=282685 RepID=UPI0002EF2772|nr:PDR/VanB family oxidoreductase [Nocardia jiangxiensis]
MDREAEYVVEVAARHEIADRVIELRLRPLDGDLPSWRPGAHIDLILTSRVTRQYSLCGDPDDNGMYTIAVLREPGGGRGGSSYIHNMVHAGYRLRIRGPRNTFALVDAERYLFIAGGIGITPLLPMIRAASARDTHWSLMYGGRTCASMAYLAELGDLSAHGAVEVCPQDRTGPLDVEKVLAAQPAGTQVYCCGPESLLAAVEQYGATCLSESLHVERFAAPPPDPSAWFDEEFEVDCVKAGVSVRVPPGTSILQALDRVGVHAAASCMEGICGICETVVLEGIPEHRDHVLTPRERVDGNRMMLCCSRARTPRLALDL